jgi:uncharacterized protein (TIGR02145 family)
MKRILLSILSLILLAALSAQVPQSFKYQSVVRATDGTVIASQTVAFKISILLGSSSGTAVYVETFSIATNQFGLAAFNIGQGTVESGVFATINWSTGLYWVKVEIDPLNGIAFTEAGTSQLLSVPYALHSETAENGFSGNYNDLTGKPVRIGDFTGDINNKVISNLLDPVSPSDASNKAYVDKLGEDMKEIALSSGDLVSDFDGNTYKKVKIGNQTWLLENLKTTHFLNGDLIPSTSPLNLDITANVSPVYQWPVNGYESNVEDYGRLYTWYTLTDPRGVCPAGWHVSSNAEWEEMIAYLGGNSVAGAKLKEAGEVHWQSGNVATNSSGFTALPGGYRSENGTFYWLGHSGYWWSATEQSATLAYRPAMLYDWVNIDMGSASGKSSGLSARCIKDNEVDKTFDGTVTLSGLAMATAAGNGKIMTSDNTGNGSWQPPVGTVPVGGLVAWLKNLSGTPSLPSNFAECNGQTISDAGSPFNGVTLPDLGSKFLMGSASSGGTGGSIVHGHSGSMTNVSANFPVTATISPPMSATSPADHTHTLSISSSSNIPPYYTVVWIIRIK